MAREPQTGGEDYEPGAGVINPHNINNTVFFIFFGIISAAFVVAGIWFFFWAKNGGFQFKEGDWEEYKSTVLRRRGPNGTIISGATAPTDLGGGSVYKDVVDEDGRTVITESTGLSGITAGVSDISARERRRALREKKIKQMQEEHRQRKKEKKEKKKKESRHVDEHGVVVDAEAEKQAEDELRKYRHERPARVGGLNKESEGSQWDGSTNPSDSTVSSSLMSNRQATPTNSPQKPAGGIRKVYSTADRTAERERERDRERLRLEARRLQDRGRQALMEREPSTHRSGRRDFSYQRAAESEVAESAVTRSSRRSERTERTERSERSERTERTERSERTERTERTMPGSWTASEVDSDLGTKSYHHPIPELRSQASSAPRRHQSSDRNRRSRSGYRRARNEDYTEE